MPFILPSVSPSCFSCHSRFSSCSTQTSPDPFSPYCLSISLASAGSSIHWAVCLPKVSLRFPVCIPVSCTPGVRGTTINRFFLATEFLQDHLLMLCQMSVHSRIQDRHGALLSQ